MGILFFNFDQMKSKCFTFTLLSLGLFLSSFRERPIFRNQNIPPDKKDSIKWYSFNEGHSKAISENKILMVNVSTESCYFCKLMDKHTYSNSGVIDTLNKYFVCVYLNPGIDSSYLLNGKKIKTKELMKYLFVDEQVAYPTSIFWLHSESEENRHVISGFKQPPIFLKLLDAARALRSSSKLGFTLKFHEITHHY